MQHRENKQETVYNKVLNGLLKMGIKFKQIFPMTKSVFYIM